MSRITVLITSAAICASAAEVRAGGMTPPVRDVRTVERAGARIAGADDADSLWLDPAGLAHLAGEGRTQLLFGIAYVAQASTTPGIDRGENRLASVSNQQSGSPIPTVAATLEIGDRLVLVATSRRRMPDFTATPTTARSVTRQSASWAPHSSI